MLRGCWIIKCIDTTVRRRAYKNRIIFIINY
jgi:hypothetical protein